MKKLIPFSSKSDPSSPLERENAPFFFKKRPTSSLAEMKKREFKSI